MGLEHLTAAWYVRGLPLDARVVLLDLSDNAHPCDDGVTVDHKFVDDVAETWELERDRVQQILRGFCEQGILHQNGELFGHDPHRWVLNLSILRYRPGKTPERFLKAREVV